METEHRAQTDVSYGKYAAYGDYKNAGAGKPSYGKYTGYGKYQSKRAANYKNYATYGKYGGAGAGLPSYGKYASYGTYKRQGDDGPYESYDEYATYSDYEKRDVADSDYVYEKRQDEASDLPPAYTNYGCYGSDDCVDKTRSVAGGAGPVAEAPPS